MSAIGRIALFTAVCSLWLPAISDAAPPHKAGEVAELIGTVYVQHNSNVKTADSDVWQQLQFGDAVYDKDLIRTEAGSKVKLIFADQSVVTIGPTTKFRIDGTVFAPETAKARVSLFSLISGKARALVSSWFSNLEKNRFEVRTPSAVAGVRGTEFVTIVGSNGNTQIMVLKGVVEVFNRRDRQRRAVYLGKGMTTKVAPNRVPSAPKQMAPEQMQQASSELDVDEQEASTEDSAGQSSGSDLDESTTLEEATDQGGSEGSGDSQQESAEQAGEEGSGSDESANEEDSDSSGDNQNESGDESGDTGNDNGGDNGAGGNEDGFSTGFGNDGFGDDGGFFGNDPLNNDLGSNNLPGQDVQRTTDVHITVDFR